MKSRFFLVLILVFCLAGFALAQTDTARVVGTITDSTGAVVANASVVVTSVDTGRTMTVQTSGSGEYVVNAVPAGKYHIEVKAPNFKTSLRLSGLYMGLPRVAWLGAITSLEEASARILQ